MYEKKKQQRSPSVSNPLLIARAMMRRESGKRLGKELGVEDDAEWGLEMEVFQKNSQNATAVNVLLKKLSFIRALLSPPPTFYITVCCTNRWRQD